MLALACTVLVEVPEILEIVFLHLEPHIVLKPIRDLLETFDASEEMFGSFRLFFKLARLILTPVCA